MQLRVTTVQSDIIWHKKAENLKKFSKLLEEIEPNSTDLVILPEMFTTGFTMTPDLVKEKFEDKTFYWMEEQANRLNATIVGSFVCKQKRDFYNRLLWMQPDSKFADYDKRHLFAHAGEDKHYTSGYKLLNVTWRDWNFCPLICYDLRFPVWSRNFKLSGMVPSYDVLIYIANWPTVRKHAWKSLLVARAIENQAYVIGVNRVGVDGNGIAYSGDTMVVDYSGTVLYCKSEECDVKTHTLNYENLYDFRQQFRFLDDQDIYKFVDSNTHL